MTTCYEKFKVDVRSFLISKIIQTYCGKFQGKPRKKCHGQCWYRELKKKKKNCTKKPNPAGIYSESQAILEKCKMPSEGYKKMN